MRFEDVQGLRGKASDLVRRELLRAVIAARPQGEEIPLKCPPTFGARPIGEGNYQLAIRVRSEEEIPRQAIEQIAQEAKRLGGDIDLKVVGEIRLLQNSVSPSTCKEHHRPVFPGLSISQSNDKSAGTLGCFIRKNNEDSADLFLLSNAHVIAQPFNEMGVSIIQPGGLDGGINGEHSIAVLEEMSTPTTGQINRIDAAIARLISPDGIDPCRINGIGSLDGFHSGYRGEPNEVIKVGRTTGVTEGRVSAIDMEATIHYPGGKGFMFEGQIEIEAPPGQRFAASGDSGSLVVDHQGKAIGLLFAVNGYGTVAYANPIDLVLEHFSASIQTQQ